MPIATTTDHVMIDYQTTGGGPDVVTASARRPSSIWWLGSTPRT